MEPLVDGDGVELLPDALDPSHHLDVIPAAELGLEDGRRGEESLALLAERIHEGAVVEFAHQGRVQLLPLEPLIEVASNRRVGARQQARGPFERTRKVAAEPVGQLRRREERRSSLAEQVVERVRP
jgi:hypothetical protein